jgi:hypothetical protein
VPSRRGGERGADTGFGLPDCHPCAAACSRCDPRDHRAAKESGCRRIGSRRGGRSPPMGVLGAGRDGEVAGFGLPLLCGGLYGAGFFQFSARGGVDEGEA